MLTSRAKRTAGFTLIEMVVTMTIFALLVALTVPTMRKWVADAKVRAVADSLQNGIRLAQTEALRRSRQVVFAFTATANPAPGFAGAVTAGSTTGNNYWAAQTIPADASETAVVVGSGPVTAGGSMITVTAPPVALCFNSVGRLVTQTSTGIGVPCLAPTLPMNGGTTPIGWTYVVSQAPLADHSMEVEVSLGGQIHLCDPTQTLSATNPYGC